MSTAKKLTDKQQRFYTYALIDPRDNSIFYIGKGCGVRAKAHLKEWRRGHVLNADKFNRIGEIVSAGLVPTIDYVARGMSEDEALRLERQMISVVGIDNLTNASPGCHTENEKALAGLRWMLKHFVARADAPKEWVDRWIHEVKSLIKLLEKGLGLSCPETEFVYLK